MAGYVPLFDSIATGTLYGRWPDIGLWPIVLALADRHGRLDVSPGYLAGVTGLPEVDVVACMKRFSAPDLCSRSKEENGARLVPLDPNRDWGWMIVNHGKYREKARLMAKDSARTAAGKDAERKRFARSPPVSPAVPLSYSDANADIRKEKKEKKKTEEAQAPIAGLDSESWSRWVAYRRESGKPLKPTSIPAAQRKLAAFGAIQPAVVEESIANGYQGLFAPKLNGRIGKVSEWE